MELLSANLQVLRHGPKSLRRTPPCPDFASFTSDIAATLDVVFSARARTNFQRWKFTDHLVPSTSQTLLFPWFGIIAEMAPMLNKAVGRVNTLFAALAPNFQRWKFLKTLAPSPTVALWISLMDKVVWLVAGNKGGVGKSVVAKAFVEWLQIHETPVLVVDGDTRTPDVHLTFKNLLVTEQFDLNDESGWQQFSDFLCETDFIGHTVTNLPDGISDRALLYSQRLVQLAIGYHFQIKVLFVINTLPDGLHLFDQLRRSFSAIFTIKNLYFGEASEFEHFDIAFAPSCDGRIILLPKMMPRIMALARSTQMPFHQFATQVGDAKTNFSYAKLVVADWLNEVYASLDEVLLGE